MRNFLLISFLLFFTQNNLIFSQIDNYGIPNNNSKDNTFKLKLNLELGYGNWNKTIPNGTQDFIVKYYHGLKDGFDIESSIIYYHKNFGIGLTGSRFDAYSVLNDVYLIDDSTGNVISVGSLEDDIRILFLGTTLCYYFKTKNEKNIFQIEFTPGYFFYNNSQKWVIYDAELKGKTLGINFGLSYDFKLSSHLGISLGYNISAGRIKELEITNENKIIDQEESMTRTNFTLGLNIYL